MSLPAPDAQSSNFLSLPQHQQNQQDQQNQENQQASPPIHSMVTPGVFGSQASHTLHTSRTPYTPVVSAAPQPSPAYPPTSMPSTLAAAPLPPAGFSDQIAHERAMDFASHSWDLATGGLKTLTAKRELPPLPDRMLGGKLQEPVDMDTPRSYIFILVILACILLMLISGGVVLFVMLQP